jgi:hypothetical protein
VREAAARWSIPVQVVEADPSEPDAWLAGMTAAVDRLL